MIGCLQEQEDLQARGHYVGQEAQERQGQLTLSWPLEHGLVQDWDDLEKVWHYAFYDGLQVPPEGHPIMMSEPPHYTRQEREKTAETLFETFNFPAMYMANQAVLAMYSTGRTTGVVLDCGAGMTNVVPVFEGFSVDHAMLRQDFGGRELTDHLVGLLSERGYNLISAADRPEVIKIKHSLCYVSQDTSAETAIEKTYELPDGTKITLKDELFLCPEVLFQPTMLTNVQAKPNGVLDMLYNSVTKCEPGYHKPLFKNMVLAGGSSLFPGLADRLGHQMAARAPEGMQVKVIAAPERYLAVWIGGSILASLPNFQTMWIKRQDYLEVGASVIHRKCF